MKIAVFPGSFDPFTIGHYDIVERSLQLFDRVIILIAINSSKKSYFNLDDRIKSIETCFQYDGRVTVKTSDLLTVDFCKTLETKDFVVVRGLRNSVDFQYEKDLAHINKLLGDIETVFLLAKPEHAICSSSFVRELFKYNKIEEAKKWFGETHCLKSQPKVMHFP